MDWKYLSIIIGILGAFLGVYFREAFRKAVQQKIITSKLEAYLLDIEHQLLRDELKIIVDYALEEFKPIATFLLEYKNSSVEKLLELSDKKTKELAKLFAQPDDKFIQSIKEKYIEIKSYSQEYYESLNKWYEEIIEDFRNDKNIITDEEAAIISKRLTQLVVLYKTNTISVARELKFHNILLRSSENFELQIFSDSLQRMVRDLIYSSVVMFFMKEELKKIVKKSTFSLMMINIIH